MVNIIEEISARKEPEAANGIYHFPRYGFNSNNCTWQYAKRHNRIRIRRTYSKRMRTKTRVKREEQRPSAPGSATPIKPPTS